MAERVLLGLQTSQITLSLAEVTKKSLPTFIVLNAEPAAKWQSIQEALFMGQYMGGSGGSNKEVWAFMNAFEFNFPSKEQLMHAKAIIVPGSDLSVSDVDSRPWMVVLKDFLR